MKFVMGLTTAALFLLLAFGSGSVSGTASAYTVNAIERYNYSPAPYITPSGPGNYGSQFTFTAQEYTYYNHMNYKWAGQVFSNVQKDNELWGFANGNYNSVSAPAKFSIVPNYGYEWSTTVSDYGNGNVYAEYTGYDFPNGQYKLDTTCITFGQLQSSFPIDIWVAIAGPLSLSVSWSSPNGATGMKSLTISQSQAQTGLNTNIYVDYTVGCPWWGLQDAYLIYVNIAGGSIAGSSCGGYDGCGTLTATYPVELS